ncbi:transposase [Rhodoferax antarcticus ANT.BR]|uniref:Transposase n=1 Tax=Rhodoferax antarcticus ANT.BR TaxID=1111071 RepID=A0A1Q8YF19_9BURK|nr:transposase [Rhodoferax antarcticus ANT.BR]
MLTPLELINRIAQLVPPPRTHRHRYYGVLAPNSPLRAAVTAMAQAEQVVAPVVHGCVADAACTAAGSAGSVPGVGAVLQPEPPANLKPRPPSHYLWAALIARIYEVFPLICPHCGGQMRIIAFITFSADIHKILEHIEVEPEAPRITPARGPPLWDECGAQETREGVEACRTGIWQTNRRPNTPTISD